MIAAVTKAVAPSTERPKGIWRMSPRCGRKRAVNSSRTYRWAASARAALQNCPRMWVVLHGV
eukprot:5578187-Lingulodinium_polyedra.AAC.1